MRQSPPPSCPPPTYAKHTTAAGNQLTVLYRRARNVNAVRDLGGNIYAKSLFVALRISVRRHNYTASIPFAEIDGDLVKLAARRCHHYIKQIAFKQR
jgi:hypothetical protein